jgi:hypothetical protein
VPRTGHVNYTTMEEIPTGEEVPVGMFFLIEHPVINLFDSGPSDDFMSSTCAKKTNLSLVALGWLAIIDGSFQTSPRLRSQLLNY